MKKNFWQEIFLELTKEERKLISLAPILLRCSKEDADLVGALVWSHFVNNDEWNGTFRNTGGVIADILNKRFSVKEWNYLDFYMSNLRWKGFELFYKDWGRIEKKYHSRICSNCKVEDLLKSARKMHNELQKMIKEAEKNEKKDQSL